jgi:hypothetical protein
MPAKHALGTFEERLDGRVPLDVWMEQVEEGFEVIPIPRRG